jgi:hypothetical protein
LNIPQTKTEPAKQPEQKPEKPARKFDPPVAWLLGRQLMRSLKGTLLYTAFGEKLDARDWMDAKVFPSMDKGSELKFWRWQAEKKAFSEESRPEDNLICSREDDEKYWQNREDFWFDYIADTGDGMKATYNIAYLCQSDLYVKTRDPLNLIIGESVEGSQKGQPPTGYDVLPCGEFLFIGGDTAYHMSDYMTLANRVQLPFIWAYEDLLEDQRITKVTLSRPLFGIPGNHDYYDQLDGFRRQFRFPVREEPLEGGFLADFDRVKRPQLFIPGFNRKQSASYIALRLPFDWWFWGLDTEVGKLDERQKKFFRDICKKRDDSKTIIPPDKLIVATCAPTTVFGKLADPEDGKAADAFGQLGLSQPFLPNSEEPRDANGKYNLSTTGDNKMKEGQCRLDISGDVHHYARYWGPATGGFPRTKAKANAPMAESYASVVSGIGGAFHHPSKTYVDEVQEQVLYPSEEKSTKEVAHKIFKFWNIWGGGYIWLAGFIISFVLYFAATVPQSSMQVINNFPLFQRLNLALQGDQITPIRPTTMPLPKNTEASINKVQEDKAKEPVTPFWNWVGDFVRSSPSTKWVPPNSAQTVNPQNYFYWPDRVPWTWDLLIGVSLFLLSPIPLIVIAIPIGAKPKPSRIVKTPDGEQIKPANINPATKAEPDKWLRFIVTSSSLMVFLGLAMIKPYRDHITPFGSSAMVLYSIIWAGAALTLSLRYTEFLFEKAHQHYITNLDWAWTGILSILSLLCTAYGLWSFGKNNLPALLVSDMIFVTLLIGTLGGLLALPFALGGELFYSNSRAVRVMGKILMGLWHAVLQIFVPFLLIRKGTCLIWSITLLLVFVPIPLGQFFLKKNSRIGIVLTWFFYGAVLLAMPLILSKLTTPYEPFLAGNSTDWWWRLMSSEPFLAETWTGWWGLVPSMLAGGIGAVMCCVWFGWYLGTCFVFNGHNNEIGGAARIEEFKQFIRFRLTKDGLTGYVIGIDKPQDSDNRHLLKPKIIDVFYLKVK